MFEQVLTVANMIVASFLHIWPYLLITIPLAVAVRMSGASKYIHGAFQARPILAIFLATAVGAFSPFCSCGVIPVVAALLIGGVPLAPIMSFWIASPSMDPEAFFLSVATIGWDLAVWRLGATLVVSLSAGLATHILVQRGWLGQQFLQSRLAPAAQPAWYRLRAGWRGSMHRLAASPPVVSVIGGATLSPAIACCGTVESAAAERRSLTAAVAPSAGSCGGEICSASDASSCRGESDSFRHRLLRETRSATWMMVKFMALAFFLSALIRLYVPAEWVAGLLGRQNPWAILLAAFLGVPVYTSNLTALPMISGLLAQGMNPSAALAFLISGPTTTLPAMAAVWGLASRRVFALYVLLSLLGAVAFGYLHALATVLW
jgi:uncharacterized membrane protein YraQ (UPF0718 family)